MKVLVTGGAGFIGSNVADELTRQDHEVHVVDNLATGSLHNLTDTNRYYQLDLRSPELDDLISRIRPEVIVHQAAQAQVSASIDNPFYDLSVNVEAALRLLESSKNHQVRKIIYASSAAIYGVPEILPQPETHPIRPLSQYGVTKYTVELYLSVYAHLYGVNYTAFRYANVYGPRQSSKGEAGVVAIFINQLLRGQTPTINGTGEATRDYIYVGDVATAIGCALSAGDQEVFNLSTNTSLSVNELYARVAERIGGPSYPKYGPDRPGDILHSRLDNTKIRHTLGWAPRTSLSEGLDSTIRWARER